MLGSGCFYNLSMVPECARLYENKQKAQCTHELLLRVYFINVGLNLEAVLKSQQ